MPLSNIRDREALESDFTSYVLFAQPMFSTRINVPLMLTVVVFLCLQQMHCRRQVGNTAKLLSKPDFALGCKLLVYINNCLSGRAFPTGEIDPAHVRRVKWEVYQLLRAHDSPDGGEGALPYPFLRTLLQFDTREFLNVLALAFAEPEAPPSGSDAYALPRHQVGCACTKVYLCRVYCLFEITLPCWCLTCDSCIRVCFV